MKLLELEIENYGLFSGRRLDFREGFQLVYGANEAGKTTLLQLVRELLFGFPIHNPYAFDDTSGEMAATALIELADGHCLRFRRRKGRVNQVVGQLEASGEPVDADDLTRLLGNARADLYQHVFGFSLAELASGEKSLEHARLDEALYGGSIGGLANFQRVQQEIQAEHQSLYAARAVNRPMNQLLRQIREQTKALRSAMVKPRDYKELLATCSQRDAEVGQQREKLDVLRRRQAHLTRLTEALAPYLARAAAERQLAELSVPAELPPDAAGQFQRSSELLDGASVELTSLEEELAGVNRELENIQLSPQLAAREAEIKRLHQQVGKMVGFRADVPLRQRDATAARDGALARMQQLDPAWDLTHLQQFQSSLEQRERLERMRAERDELDRSLAERDARRPALARDVAQASDRLAELAVIHAAPELQDLIQRHGGYQSDQEMREQLRREYERVETEISTLRGKLSAPLERPVDVAESLPVPMETTVSEFRQRFADADKAIARQQQRLQQARSDAEEKQRLLAELEADQSVPDREELAGSRARRDAGWQLIRQKYVRRKQVDDEAARWLVSAEQTLPDAFEEELRRSDWLADQRQARSELVARREQLAREIDHGQQRTGQVAREGDQAQAEMAEVQQQWNDLWASCQFRPLSPEAMLDWLRLHSDLLEKLEQQNVREIRLREFDARIGDFDDELRDALPEVPESTERRMAAAVERVEKARQAAAQKKTYQAQLPDKERELESLDAEVAELKRQCDVWNDRWRELLAEFHFPEHWDVHLATRILSGLGEARFEFQKAETFQRRIDDMQRETEQFASQVNCLSQELAPELLSLPPEDAVIQLNQRLEAAKQAQRDQARLQGDKDKLEKRTGAKRDQRQQFQQQRDGLLAAAGAETADAFHEVAARATRRDELRQAMDSCGEKIAVIRGTEEERSFLHELDGADADTLAAQLRALAEELGEAENSYEKAVEAASIQREQLKQLDGESQAAMLATQLESTRSQLAAVVDRWAPLVLARALMQQAITRFEREHQPQMLREVKRLLTHMTHGQYVGVRRQLDQRGTLLIEGRDGSLKEPRQLSTGTREQLYLAIRLAYVNHYCRQSEPLPLVMDDVLVNFDDLRAKHTLEVLLEVAESLQIIFLTCHQNIVDLVTAANPALEPVRLEVEGTANALLGAASETPAR